MLNFWSKLLVFLAGNIAFINCSLNTIPWAHSYYHLKMLAKEEAKIIDLLHERKNMENYQHLDNKCYMMDYEDSSTYAQYKTLNTIITDKEDVQIDKIVADNPILAYRMVRRIIKLAGYIVPKYSATMKELNQHVQLMKRKFKGPLPTQTELNHLIDNILRIVLHYNLDVQMFASKGQILLNGQNFTSAVGFTRDQMVEIGQHALRGNLFTEAIHWYNAALNEKVSGKNLCIKYNRTGILHLIEEAKATHDKFLQEGDFGFLPYITDYENPYRYLDRFNSEHPEEPILVKDIFEQEYLEFRQPSNKSLEKDFEYLCNGKFKFDKERLEKDGKRDCWYQYSDPANLVPYKMEVHSRNVIQVYDLINPQIIKQLIHHSQPTATRRNSTKSFPDGLPYYKNQKTVGEKDTDYNTFVQNELEIKSDLRFENELYDAVQRMTGGKIHQSSPLYIESFGVGGYNTHGDDFTPKFYKKLGNETEQSMGVLYYLTDVSIGGQTAFLDDELTVQPVKGSVVFFRNNPKFGECPVVLGHKMIALKMFDREY